MRKLIIVCTSLAVILAITAAILIIFSGSTGNPEVLITYYIIILLSIIFMMFGDEYNFSLNKVFMLFSLFFFGIAPTVQYIQGVVLWWGPAFSDADYINTNLLIIVIIIAYQLIYRLANKVRISSFENHLLQKINNCREISINKIVLLSLSSLLITFIVYNFSLSNMLLRSGSTISINQSVFLIYSCFIRPIPIITLIYYKLNRSDQTDLKQNRIIEILMLIIIMISNFPTATPRFYTAAIYIPLLIVYIKSIQKKYMQLNSLIIYGLLLAFPLLDQFRRISELKDTKFEFNFNMFLTEHFDSYQMLMHVIIENIVTFGKQLQTSVLFFIPRSVWPEKSIGSGAFVAEKLNYLFTNVSMNYFGEGYINFGYYGIVLFTIFIAVLFSRIDKYYWSHHDSSYVLSAQYYLLVGLVIFILRGDLLSATAYTVGILLSAAFVNSFILKRIKLTL